MIYAAKIIKDSNKYKNILSAPSSQSGNKRERADISGMSKKNIILFAFSKFIRYFCKKTPIRTQNEKFSTVNIYYQSLNSYTHEETPATSIGASLLVSRTGSDGADVAELRNIHLPVLIRAPNPHSRCRNPLRRKYKGYLHLFVCIIDAGYQRRKNRLFLVNRRFWK